MGSASTGNQGTDAPGSERPTVAVEVVTAIGHQHRRPLAGSAALASHGWDLIDQRQQLGDVVSVATGQADRQRNAPRIADEVVLAARSCPIDRTCAGCLPPLRARRWAASITARDQSS
jgi:hypothetical protein